MIDALLGSTAGRRMWTLGCSVGDLVGGRRGLQGYWRGVWRFERRGKCGDGGDFGGEFGSTAGRRMWTMGCSVGDLVGGRREFAGLLGRDLTVSDGGASVVMGVILVGDLVGGRREFAGYWGGVWGF